MNFRVADPEFTGCDACYNPVVLLKFSVRSALSDREVKIITRYILREHLGPFTFALTALTSLMLLNFISRQFGELVGKGLGWNVIGEFLLLSLPFTVALTIPMSVLVAVLYAFSRLASENEVTAMKANGVSPLRLVSPALAFGLVMTIGLLAFNDQVLPRANHRLKTLQDDISQTKPTLLLKDQVINAIAEGKFYLKAGKINGGRLSEVVIYDLSDPMRRRTIYAQRGEIAMASNRRDLDMTLYDGEMQEVATDKPSQLDRMFYKKDRIRIRDVLNEFNPRDANPGDKGDREMGICEMQKRLWTAEGSYQTAKREFEDAAKHKPNETTAPVFQRVPEPHGIGWAYCTLLGRIFSVKTAQAAELPQQQAQDTSSKKKPASSTMVFEGGKLVGPALPGQAAPVAGAIKQDTGRKTPPVQPAPVVTGAPAVVLGGGAQAQQPVPGAPVPGAPGALTQEQIAAQAAAEVMRSNAAQVVVSTPAAGGAMFNSMESQAKLRLEMAQRSRDRYQIEIHKKFSLAAACLIFCIVAPPIALRFPRGGVGLVIGVSLAVFAIYYVGLIGGESLANKGLVPPFWAMWGTNVIMTLLGVVLMVRMGRDSGSARGGGIREWLDERSLLREERKAA